MTLYASYALTVSLECGTNVLLYLLYVMDSEHNLTGESSIDDVGRQYLWIPISGLKRVKNTCLLRRLLHLGCFDLRGHFISKLKCLKRCSPFKDIHGRCDLALLVT